MPSDRRQSGFSVQTLEPFCFGPWGTGPWGTVPSGPFSAVQRRSFFFFSYFLQFFGDVAFLTHLFLDNEGAGGAGGVPSGKESGKGDKGNRAKLSDFEFVKMDGKRLVCRREK